MMDVEEHVELIEEVDSSLIIMSV
jgi:hypothetical protein